MQKRCPCRRHHAKQAQTDQTTIEGHDPAVIAVNPCHERSTQPAQDNEFTQIIRRDRDIGDLTCDGSACGDRDTCIGLGEGG